MSPNLNRRKFIGHTGIALCAAPYVLTAQKSGSGKIVGSGDYQFEVEHHFVELPDKFNWQTTHNVAVDKNDHIYVIHEGQKSQPDHPSIFVFDGNGKYVRSFGKQYQGGGHGLEVRTEGKDQFLYITGYQHLKLFAKLTLTGEVVWEKRAPMESGRYAEGEASDPKQVWGRDRFMPTNHAFHPDGGFFLADGYGGYCIHRYDKEGKWQSVIGKPGQGDLEFRLPHGLWVDDRPERTPSLVIADRVNARLQWLTFEGKHIKTMDGFILPANVDTYKDLMVVPDLSARITLLDKDDKVVAQLGEDQSWREKVLADGFKLRRQPENWKNGRFLHPHDACFDNHGNIIVAEWVSTGRVTRLKRLG